MNSLVNQAPRAHTADTNSKHTGQLDAASGDSPKKVASDPLVFLPDNASSSSIPFEPKSQPGADPSAGDAEMPSNPLASIQALMQQLQAMTAGITGKETPSADKGTSDDSSKVSDGDARRKARADGTSETEKAGAEKRANRRGRSEESAGGAEETTSSSETSSPSGKDPLTSPQQGTSSPQGGEEKGPESGSVALDGAPQAATVSDFKTINPGEGPEMITDANGKFVFNGVVDDSFLPEDVKAGMKESVAKNKDLSFFKDNFNNEQDMYQYLVHMANLESARGTSLENSQDAIGSNTGGSAGYMHLHMNYGLKPEMYGKPLNTEGWTKEEVLSDYSKYTDLTMRHLDASYQESGGNADAAQGVWWTGGAPTDSKTADAGRYYRQALSGGTGVNHNTGAAYT